MRSSLKVGDEITTIGGIIGTIVELNEDTLVIETSEDRVRVQFARWAISTVGKQTTAQQ
jgi:preprotein translocase subunit YajC